MKMRNKMTMLLGAAVIALGTFGLVGCSEATAPADDTSAALAVATMPAPDMEPGTFTEGTMDMELRADAPASDRKRHPFGNLFRHLKLTEEQQVTIHRLLAAHEDCVEGILTRLRATEREILAPFAARRDEIIAKVRAGELTREEARPLLGEINREARAALKDNPAREAARAALKDCRDKFIEALKGILTEEQIVILERWLASSGPHGPRDDKGGPRGPRGGGSSDSTNTGGRPPRG